MVYNFADIDDYKKFPSRPIQSPDNSFQFPASAVQKYPRTITNSKGKPLPFEQFLEDEKTVAFLIIQRDTILYESYCKGYDAEAMVASFSMAKSVVSLLIGCAIDDGLIGSVNDPVTQYLPGLKKNGFDSVTIEHVLQMTSGIRFNESYINPFGHAASFYYGRNLRKSTSKLKLKEAPGTEFEYVSGNTQLLTMILEKALGGETVSAYLERRIWKPLQMEYSASWSLDRQENGIEKGFCCLNARARDFAKIGRLYLNGGRWNGKQIVSEAWIQKSTSLDLTNGSVGFYQYQWWLPRDDGSYGAQGILGQYIYVNPKKDMVIVRLGKKPGRVDWWQLFGQLASMY